MTDGPVHWLENVDGNAELVRTACRRFEWWTNAARQGGKSKLLDPLRVPLQPVTCLECLEAMKQKEKAANG